MAPAMAPRANGKLGPVTPGMARVVFVRPASACDTSDHAVVVDENGKFIANLSGGTAFAADVAPGRHAFFLWPGMDLRSEKVAGFRPVSVFDLQLQSEASSVVKIDVAAPTEGRGRCYSQSVFVWEREQATLDEGALSELRFMDADPRAGDAYLHERKELSAAYFEMAHDVLVAHRNREAQMADRNDRLKKAGLN